MKRFLAVVLMVFLMVGCFPAYADNIDLSAMSEDELKALIDDARLELVKYHPAAVDGTVLYEDENVKITFTGNVELNEYDSLRIDVIVENYSDHNLSVILQNVSCNGWAIWDGSVRVPANKKAKDTFDFMDAVTEAELGKAEDVQDIEADLSYIDTDTWDTVGDGDHVVWNF